MVPDLKKRKRRKVGRWMTTEREVYKKRPRTDVRVDAIPIELSLIKV